MSQLRTRKKAPKKQSTFQKLWAKAEKLKEKNARFQKRLDDIIQRMKTDIEPIEKTTIEAQIPLLMQLLKLGQRKTLAKWQRQELDFWAKEILSSIEILDTLEDELLAELARYDAYNLGIILDESSSIPLPQQLEREIEGYQEQKKHPAELLHEEILRDIEKDLDDIFGAPPPRPQPSGNATGDMFQKELNEEQQEQERLFQTYHQERGATFEAMLKARLRIIGDHNDEFLDTDFLDIEELIPDEDEENYKTPTMSDAVFKRLFRLTAGKLHPDREPNPEIREEKQTLMASLLRAKKQGDVMTIIQMYQKHVDANSSFSKAEEKQLIQTLNRQIEDLQIAQEEYILESPYHLTAYENFYHQSQKKTDTAFKQHIQIMTEAAEEAHLKAVSIKSLSTLKPHLEQRYDERRFTHPFMSEEGGFY